MFKKGDLAVYPAHGVGVIETIESQEISGCRQDFYIIRIHPIEAIPYLIIGIIIGFSVGLASIASIFYRKNLEKNLNIQKVLIKKSKQKKGRISFLDEYNGKIEKPQENNHDPES